jgi:hypothetical protein
VAVFREVFFEGYFTKNTTTPHFFDGDTIYTALEHPHSRNGTNNFDSILYFIIYILHLTLKT